MYQQARQKLGLGIDKSAESLIPTFQAPVPTSFRFNQDTPGYIEDVKFALWLCERDPPVPGDSSTSVSKCEGLSGSSAHTKVFVDVTVSMCGR